MTLHGYLHPDCDASELEFRIGLFRSCGVREEHLWIYERIGDALVRLRRGDVLTVLSFPDCGCGSLHEVKDLLAFLHRRGCTLRTLEAPVLDTGAPAGDTMSLLTTFLEIDSACRSGRTRAALRTLRSRGRKLGRPVGSGQSGTRIMQHLWHYYRSDRSMSELCTAAGTHIQTFYTYLHKYGLPTRKAVRENPALDPFRCGLLPKPSRMASGERQDGEGLLAE